MTSSFKVFDHQVTYSRLLYTFSNQVIITGITKSHMASNWKASTSCHNVVTSPI